MTADEDKGDQNGKDDADVRAAEYVLGTLDPDEREQAQSQLATDADFAGLVQKWERRLGELNVLVAPVEPPPETWDKVKALVASEAPVEPVAPVAEAKPPEPEAPVVPEIPPPSRVDVPAEVPRSAEVIVLARRVRRWRRIALFAGAIAACLAALVVVRDYRPDLLPEQLRPTPIIQIVDRPVEVPSPRPAQYVAVLQKDNVSPAFLLTFDFEKHTVSVRRVGAERQPGKSYELWLIAGTSVPESLGVLGTGEFTVRPQPAAYDQVTLSLASYAVSLEPEGGSPTGKPTDVLYVAKLIQATPRGFDVQSP
jgi:anti-sigma-K factor RskA